MLHCNERLFEVPTKTFKEIEFLESENANVLKARSLAQVEFLHIGVFTVLSGYLRHAISNTDKYIYIYIFLISCTHTSTNW